MIVFFLLIQLAFAFTKPCIIFYTGGSNLMSTSIYNDFLSELNHIDVYKIPFQCNKQSDEFITMLKDKYSSVNLLGHSSGCVRLLNNCNNNVDRVILLDPVKTPSWDKEKNYNYLKDLLIINAEKSYKWSYIPPFVPFIPFFNIKESDINIDKEKCKVLTVHEYGHSDLIDKPYRDVMHYSRISVGYKNRDNMRKYHRFLSKIITRFINRPEPKTVEI